MTGELLALGASHKTAPLPLREKLALPAGRAARVLGELTEHDGVHEAVALFTCNRTELYLVTDDAARGGERRARDPVPAGRAAPHRADRLALLAARPRGGGAPVLGHRRARLDDRRRGRDPGSGQARLRDGAGRGRQRAGLQPPLPRRARGRQAGAHRDRRGALERVDLDRRGAAGGRLPRRPGRPARAGDRRRRERRADRPRAARPRRADAVRGQPPLRPRARAGAALRRPAP